MFRLFVILRPTTTYGMTVFLTITTRNIFLCVVMWEIRRDPGSGNSLSLRGISRSRLYIVASTLQPTLMLTQ